MVYECNRCGALFDEPAGEPICYEDYNGVSSMFDDYHYGEIAVCPECGSEHIQERYSIDELVTLCDINDCADCPRLGDDCDGRDDDDRIAYYEKEGDEYVYYDSEDHELYREPA